MCGGRANHNNCRVAIGVSICHPHRPRASTIWLSKLIHMIWIFGHGGSRIRVSTTFLYTKSIREQNFLKPEDSMNHYNIVLYGLEQHLWRSRRKIRICCPRKVKQRRRNTWLEPSRTVEWNGGMPWLPWWMVSHANGTKPQLRANADRSIFSYPPQ